MSDIITAITIKNMAREMVKRATVKNAALREVAENASYGEVTKLIKRHEEKESDYDRKHGRQVWEVKDSKGKTTITELYQSQIDSIKSKMN